jgi:hypothetical protein
MEKRRFIAAPLDLKHGTYRAYMVSGDGEIWGWFEHF